MNANEIIVEAMVNGSVWGTINGSAFRAVQVFSPTNQRKVWWVHGNSFTNPEKRQIARAINKAFVSTPRAEFEGHGRVGRPALGARTQKVTVFNP